MGSNRVYFYSAGRSEVSIWDLAGRLVEKIGIELEGRVIGFAMLSPSGFLFDTTVAAQGSPGTARLVLVKDGLTQTVKEWKMGRSLPVKGEKAIGTFKHVAPSGRLYFVSETMDFKKIPPTQKEVIFAADKLLIDVAELAL